MSPSANTSASAERTDSRTRSVRAISTIGSYDTDVASPPLGPSTDGGRPLPPTPTASTSIPAPRSRSRSRSRSSRSRSGSSARSRARLSSLAIASLLAFALNPLVEALKRRTGWHRRTAAGVVLVATARHRRGRRRAHHRADDPRGPRLQQADPEDRRRISATSRSSGRGCARPTRRRRCRSGSTTCPKHLERQLQADRERGRRDRRRRRGRAVHDPARDHDRCSTASTSSDGVRRLVPARRRDDADRIGRLVYEVVGRYIAGTLLVAALAGVVDAHRRRSRSASRSRR